MTPTYQGEIQFAGYSDSSRSGPRITMRLHDRDDLQLFVGKEGKRFALVLVEIGDDEQAVQPIAEPVEKPKGGPLAKLAGMWSNDPDFWEFLTETYRETKSSDDAALIIRNLCDVKSRAELDNDPRAAELFHQRIRLRYTRWKQGIKS